MILRVPMLKASELLLEDDRHHDYWDVVMTPLVEQGTAARVMTRTFEGAVGEALKVEWDEVKHVTPSYSVAWAAVATSAEDADSRMKKDQLEVGVGCSAKVEIESVGDSVFRTQWKVNWNYSEMDHHPMGTWSAVNGVAAETTMWRTLELVDNNHNMTCSHAVLLGTQMEMGAAGQKSTGNVLMIFARLEHGDAKPLTAMEQRSRPPVGTNAVWLFSMPLSEFVPWHMQRATPADDAPAFYSWMMAATSSTGAVRLEAVGSSGPTAIVATSREWMAPTGFEPSRSDLPPFRPMPSESDMFKISYNLETADGTVRATWPMRAERWERCKLALEKDEADARALEFATRAAESMEVSNEPFGDQPEVLRAWLGEDGRVRVCCSRRVVVEVTREVDRPPRSTLSVWCVDTPIAGWEDAAASLRVDESAGAAERLLAGVRDGKARLSDVQFMPVSLGNVAAENTVQDAVLGIGNYVNTAAHRDGVWFNPRTLGEVQMLRSCVGDWQSTGALTIHEWRGPVEQRWWDMGLATRVSEKRQESGLRLPVQPVSVMQASTFQPPGEPLVVGVVRLDSGAGYRWWVCRRDAMDPDPVEKGTSPHHYAHFTIVKSKDALTDHPQVLNEVVVALNENVQTRAVSGREWSFIDPTPTNGEPEDISPPKPDGSAFDDQWYVKRHMSGIDVSIENMQWTLHYDAAQPKIVLQRGILPEELGVNEGQKPMPLPMVVQRPGFTTLEATGEVPKPGQTSLADLAHGLTLRIEVK